MSYTHYDHYFTPAGKRELRAMLESLQHARNASTFETASFCSTPETAKNIAAITALHRATWILAPLDAVIKRIKEILGDT